MDALKKSVEKELEEERHSKAARARKAAKARMQRAVTPSSSTCSLTTSSMEEQEPAEKIKAMKKGKITTEEAPVKVPSKTQTASKPRAKRLLE